MFVSIFLLILSLLLARSNFKLQSKLLWICFIAFSYLSIFLLVGYEVLQNIFGSEIFEAIVFHLVFGIKGSGLDDYYLPIVLTIISIGSLVYLVPKYKNFLINQNKTTFNGYLALCLIFCSIIFTPIIKDFHKFITLNETSTDDNFFFEQDISYSDSTNNVIFLYLEQLERTYFDETLFPGLTPNLASLEKLSLSFTNISSPKATNWTIAGMSASQCGIPLYTPVASGSSMSGVDEFLPSALCIGDILKNRNYNLHFIGGADLDFGGKGKFYKSHGFDVVEGWTELKTQINDPYYRSPWGVYDDELLDIVLERINSLNKDKNPFGVFALTLDTHHPNGYISDSCKDKPYKDGSNPILNAVHCADLLAGRFIENILTSPIYKNTTLVVLSDHYARVNTASDMLDKGNRKNLFMIFDANVNPRKLHMKGNVFDVGPTVLSLIGTDVKGLGLGRNLFFQESLETQDIDKIISLNKKKVLNLWSFPQLDSGFNVDLVKRRINFGDRYSQFPAIFVFDNNQIEKIFYDFYYSVPLSRKIIDLNWTGAGNDDLHKSYIWIDECLKIYASINTESIPETYCINIVNKQLDKSLILPLNDPALTQEFILNYLLP